MIWGLEMLFDPKLGCCSFVLCIYMPLELQTNDLTIIFLSGFDFPQRWRI